MNNKTLAIVTGIPVAIFFFSGMFGLSMSDGDTTIFAIWMMIAMVWSLVRLYKTNDNA